MNDFWLNKKVLVTGAGGFIGSHLLESLCTLGAQVRAFVRYTSRNDPGLLSILPREILSNLEIVSGDLRDLNAVQSAMKGITHVFHLGALIAIPYSYLHPAEVVETNVLGTMNVLLAAQGHDVQRLVHTSTSEVYGTALRVPIDETHPLQGQSPYSASKIGADKLAESFFLSFDLPIVTVRPFNSFGPRQSGRAVIPTIISQALVNRTIRLGNLDTLRDFTYVSDTVDGFLAAGEVDGVEGEVFNLGTGREVRIGDVADIIASRVGHVVAIEVDPARLRPQKSEVLRLVSNNAHAGNTLGWMPKVDLETGLDYSITWVRNNLNRYKPDTYEI